MSDVKASLLQFWHGAIEDQLGVNAAPISLQNLREEDGRIFLTYCLLRDHAVTTTLIEKLDGADLSNRDAAREFFEGFIHRLDDIGKYLIAAMLQYKGSVCDGSSMTIDVSGGDLTSKATVKIVRERDGLECMKHYLKVSTLIEC